MIGDISYKNYRKKSDIHGSVLYPAVMVAPVQKKILQNLIEIDEIGCIFDPFHGSGTSLYEAMEISKDICLIGCDINPLANLITKVKLQGVSSDIEKDINKLKRIINLNSNEKLHYFDNIEKWFRKDVQESLSVLRNAIISIENIQNRLFFWYIMCDIIRKYSNTRSSTYKLHIKDTKVINSMDNKVIDDYLSSVEKNYFRFDKSSNEIKLFKCDILEKINFFEDRSIDVVITSPPYGDNGTTVTYGQFSILALKWIDEKDLELEGWELDNFSIIDRKSMGGSAKEVNFDNYEIELIKPYINKISNKKQNKVIRFFNDYFKFLRGIVRITNKYIVMTLGNRTVDGVNIDLTKITQMFLEKNKYTKKEIMEREIPSKRIPKKTSKVNNKPVNSMSKEYVIIYGR
ncbi:hypothetical protein [Clostridioides sp. ES-S-0010-02]|uniref:hypothetical protein n=1 Tax=Clostridioides sp. ES-S-0010-02 TaxID=2770776 RepID=UPI001D10FEFE|nr:hypothetical protein JJC01_03850 [Clostridioides sp. ES-S-0010-02]